MGAYSDAVHNLFVELAMEEMDHVTGIQTYLGRCIEFSCPISADTLVCCWITHALSHYNCPAVSNSALTGLIANIIRCRLSSCCSAPD